MLLGSSKDVKQYDVSTSVQAHNAIRHITRQLPVRYTIRMRFLTTEVKVFLLAISLTVVVLSFIFAVPLPLYNEHGLVSSRFYAWYVTNFFYSMSLYFVFTALFYVLIYCLTKPLRNEVKVFAITFFTVFWGVPGFLLTNSAYWGNVGHPLWVIFIWNQWWMPAEMLGIALLSLMPAGFSVLVYEIYRMAGKLRTNRGKHRF